MVTSKEVREEIVQKENNKQKCPRKKKSRASILVDAANAEITDESDDDTHDPSIDFMNIQI